MVKQLHTRSTYNDAPAEKVFDHVKDPRHFLETFAGAWRGRGRSSTVRRLTASGAAALVLLVACSDAAEPAPGAFQGSGDEGFEITFTVEEDLTIRKASYKMACGPVSVENDVNFIPAHEIEGSSFTLRTPSETVTGQFEGDGTEVSGSWEVGDCSGEWRGRRTGD